jgi:hypothetical protein
MVEKILEPMLKERVVGLYENYSVWIPPSGILDGAFLVSMDVVGTGGQFPRISETLKTSCVWCVSLDHPFRDDVVRFMAVFSSLPSKTVFTELASFYPTRGEVHTKGDHDHLKANLKEVGLEFFKINASNAVGYILHDKATELTSQQ